MLSTIGASAAVILIAGLAYLWPSRAAHSTGDPARRRQGQAAPARARRAAAHGRALPVAADVTVGTARYQILSAALERAARTR
jgi:hypothetical protein